MSLSADRSGPAATTAAGTAPPELRVDRVACTGHGMCAQLLPGRVRLDPWGYPVVDEARVDPEDGERAVRFCPARALYWAERL